MVAPPDNDVLWARALHFQHNGSPALCGVSLGVREGEILAVTGPRGSGKTTLLQCLAGLLPAQRGEVWFNSTPVHTMGAVTRERLRRERFGWIDPVPVLLGELNAWENAALPLMLRGTSRRLAKTRALEWLERLDIGGCARKRPSELSRAERQRIAVARALAACPTVLFADEPTASLHRADGAQVLRTLTTAARSHGITVVLAAHHTDAADVADRTVSLLDGRCVKTVHLPPLSPGPEEPEEPKAPAEGASPSSEGQASPETEDQASARPEDRASPEPQSQVSPDSEGHTECSLSV